MHREKPFSPSCERNSEPILGELKKFIGPTNKKLFEIGSGTGQHAFYLAREFPHLKWQTSDLVENHEAIEAWTAEIGNVLSPVEFQVPKSQISFDVYDTVFTANTLHIMSWNNVTKLIEQLGQSLPISAQFLIYGPFNYRGEFTSESNREFDAWLKKRDPLSGVRDLENVEKQFTMSGFHLSHDIEMPANNRFLRFQKETKYPE